MKRKQTDKYPHVLKWLGEYTEGAVAEYRFHPTRLRRMDFAIPGLKLGIEVDGGVWSGGRHSGGAGQIKDMEKGNAAVMLGWRVLHYTPQQIRTRDWLDDVRAVTALIIDPEDHG